MPEIPRKIAATTIPHEEHIKSQAKIVRKLCRKIDNISTVTCSACNKKGHITAKCFKLTCFDCIEAGRIAKFCPIKNDEDGCKILQPTSRITLKLNI